MKKTYDLILLTAAFRFENLRKMAKSIDAELGNIENLNILWLICVDNNNGIGDINNEFAKIFTYNFQWLAINSGKPGQKNYGGDMFNKPLEMTVNTYYQGRTPWVYVFDDDNLINPLFAEKIYEMIDTAESENKSVIWMSKLTANGEFCNVRRIEAFSMNKYKTLTNHLSLPDPSQLVIRYDYLKDKMLMFDDEHGSLYDLRIWAQLYQTYESDVLFQEDLPGKTGYEMTFQCTHNAIPSTEMMLQANEVLDSNIPSYCYMGICSDKYGNSAIRLPKEVAKKAFEMLKEYNKNNDY